MNHNNNNKTTTDDIANRLKPTDFLKLDDDKKIKYLLLHGSYKGNNFINTNSDE